MTANASIGIDFAACLAQYKVLSETRIRVDAELERVKQRLAEISADAVRDFGTSDLGELKAILEQRTARNNELRKQFIERMAQMEGNLAALTAPNDALFLQYLDGHGNEAP